MKVLYVGAYLFASKILLTVDSPESATTQWEGTGLVVHFATSVAANDGSTVRGSGAGILPSLDFILRGYSRMPATARVVAASLRLATSRCPRSPRFHDKRCRRSRADRL